MPLEVGANVLKACWSVVWDLLEGDNRFTTLVPAARRDKTQFSPPIKPVDARLIGDTPRVGVYVKGAKLIPFETTSNTGVQVTLEVLVESTSQYAGNALDVAQAVARVLSRAPHEKGMYTSNGAVFIRTVQLGDLAVESGPGWRSGLVITFECEVSRQWWIYGS